jgi:hypothetical protein
MSQHCRITTVLVLCAVGLAGCGTGFGEYRPGDPMKAPVEVPDKVYSGLKGQTAAVMIWADARVRAEYNQIQVDLARLIQNRLVEKTKPSKEKEREKEQAPLAGATFLDPRSVVRYQREHPELDGLPIQDVAPRLGVKRVIYIEMEDFSAHSAKSILLLKGEAKATLRVVEVDDNRKARVVFEEPGLTANFPHNAPEGVIASDKMNVRTVYEGTLEQLADRIAVRFGDQPEK